MEEEDAWDKEVLWSCPEVAGRQRQFLVKTEPEKLTKEFLDMPKISSNGVSLDGRL